MRVIAGMSAATAGRMIREVMLNAVMAGTSPAMTKQMTKK
jgi:hypothetical protein